MLARHKGETEVVAYSSDGRIEQRTEECVKVKQSDYILVQESISTNTSKQR